MRVCLKSPAVRLDVVLQGVAICVLCLIANIDSYAREIGGVHLREKMSVKGIDDPLVLNGAGIRYKFFFKIYVAALYIPEKLHRENLILRSSEYDTYQANRMIMHFLYSEISKQKITNAWIESFKDNLATTMFNNVQGRLHAFNQMFPDLYEGDIVLLDYLPHVGTRVIINGDNKGIIKGIDFNQALLSVWLGENPVTEDLKSALLGIDND